MNSVFREVGNTILALGILYTTYNQSSLDIPVEISCICESEIFVALFALFYMSRQVGSGFSPLGAFVAFMMYRLLKKQNKKRKM